MTKVTVKKIRTRHYLVYSSNSATGIPLVNGRSFLMLTAVTFVAHPQRYKPSLEPFMIFCDIYLPKGSPIYHDGRFTLWDLVHIKYSPQSNLHQKHMPGEPIVVSVAVPIVRCVIPQFEGKKYRNCVCLIRLYLSFLITCITRITLLSGTRSLCNHQKVVIYF